GEQARLQRIAQLINKLPEINYHNLCYLVRFLARVAEYSSENKMTPTNLGICIGCSILYGKDQSSINQSISNSYTAASTILELMIIHHKQLFTNSSQQEQTLKSFKSQPDLIPTEFHSKSRSGSNENLLDVQNLSGYAQPSPGTRRKNKAPRPPTTSSINPQTSIIEQINSENVSYDLNSTEQTSNQCSTVTSSSSFSSSDKIHRRTPSDGIQLDRPGAPPPLPPSVIVSPSPIVQPRQKLSFPLLKSNNEQRFSTAIEDKTIENDPTTDLSTDSTSTTNDGVNVGKLISQINNRMASGKSNNTQINNNRISCIRNSQLPSPGDTTDF
ncbi:unnamed protein product, partial [Rotaria sp. Silwood2]